MGGVSENRPPRPRRRRPLRVAVGLLVLFAVIGYFAAQRNSNGGGAPYCTASAAGADPEEYELSPEQASNAATIAAVGISRGLPDRAVTIALATAMQESALRNLDHGDRDSLGLFQQRPSMGWGTPEEITDPVYSAAVFYDHLVEVPGYSRLPLTVAAQKVQRSGFPQAYAKHEPDATVLTAAFGGAGTLVCSGPVPAAGDPERVRTELVRAFGKEALGEGPAPASNAPGAAAAGAEEEGRVDVRLKRDGGPAEERRGRAVAHWAVARSQELGIARVSYGGGDWTGGRAGRAWRPRAADGAPGGGDRQDAPGAEVRIFTAR
ncbi:hypothetical protein [Streptomyces sp. NPDC058613]|uniref:hypothetical protein n=1 Tax=Streptomyces sp. NPDC058613 TaxID=3346556 RepID=UPI0036574581